MTSSLPRRKVHQSTRATSISANGCPILRAKKIRLRPFYNTRHSYVSFLYSIGAKSGFISSQTGDSIKTLESDYAKYIKEADDNRDFVENQIQKSETQAKPRSDADTSPTPSEIKKPPKNRGLKNGAGEEGRTPDLMLGKHRVKKRLADASSAMLRRILESATVYPLFHCQTVIPKRPERTLPTPKKVQRCTWRFPFLILFTESLDV